MKTIVETPVGGDGARAGLYVDGQDLQLTVKMPVQKIVEPVLSALDRGVDKLEQLIPGDQKELAEKMKANLREEILEAITGAGAQPAQVEGAPV